MTGPRSWVGLAGARGARRPLGSRSRPRGPEIVPAAGRGPNGTTRLAAGPLRRRVRDRRRLRHLARARDARRLRGGAALRAGAARRGCCGASMIAIVGVFALAPPLLSLDVFSYVSYARLEAQHGLNPYDFPPAAVPSDPAVPFVADFRDAGQRLRPGVHAADPAARLARRRRRGLVAEGDRGRERARDRRRSRRGRRRRGLGPAAAAALVALNPLVLVHVVGGGPQRRADGAADDRRGGGAARRRGDVAGGAGLARPRRRSRHRPLVVGAFAAARRAAAAARLAGRVRPRRAGRDRRARAGRRSAAGWTRRSRSSGRTRTAPSYMSLPATLTRELGLDIDHGRAVVPRGLRRRRGRAARSWTARGADWVRGGRMGRRRRCCSRAATSPPGT